MLKIFVDTSDSLYLAVILAVSLNETPGFASPCFLKLEVFAYLL